MASKYDNMLQAARLIMLHGMEVAEVADALGVTTRTIQNYLVDKAWGNACDAANADTYTRLAASSLAVIEAQLQKGDAPTARWVAERMLPRLNGAQGLREGAIEDMKQFSVPEDAEGNALEEDELDALSVEELRARKKAFERS